MIVYKFILRNLCLRQRFLLLLTLFLIYSSFDERICYPRKSIQSWPKEEYPYVDYLISTFLVLGVFDLKLPFSDSLGRNRNQDGARRVASAAKTIVTAEAEHARDSTSTIVIITAAHKPGTTTGIREGRVIAVPATII